jgi:hypothetical protein
MYVVVGIFKPVTYISKFSGLTPSVPYSSNTFFIVNVELGVVYFAAPTLL